MDGSCGPPRFKLAYLRFATLDVDLFLMLVRLWIIRRVLTWVNILLWNAFVDVKQSVHLSLRRRKQDSEWHELKTEWHGEQCQPDGWKKESVEPYDGRAEQARQRVSTACQESHGQLARKLGATSATPLSLPTATCIKTTLRVLTAI